MKVTFGGLSPTQKVKIPIKQKIIIPHNKVSPEVMQKINNFGIKTIGIFKKNGWLKDVITYNKNKTIERIEGFYPKGERGYLVRFKPDETSIGIIFHKNGVKSSIGLFDSEGQTTHLKLIRPDKTLKFTRKINPDGGLTEAYFSIKSIIEQYLRFDANKQLKEAAVFYPSGKDWYNRKIYPDNTSLQREYYEKNGSLKIIAAINADMEITKQRHFHPDRKFDYSKEINPDGTSTEKHFANNKLVTKFEYDADNNIKTISGFHPNKKLGYIKEINPDGSFIQTSYNEDGERVLIANIDSNDIVQKSTQFHPGGIRKHIVTEYNPDRSYTIEYFADDVNETLEAREAYTLLEKIKTSTSFHVSNNKRAAELDFNPDESFTKRLYALDGETLEWVEEYDKLEQLKKNIKLFPNGKENIVVEYNPDRSFSQKDYNLNKKLIMISEFDAKEILIKSKEFYPLGGKVKYTKERNLDGSFTEHWYDKVGNLNAKAQVDKNDKLISLEQYYGPRNPIDYDKVEYSKERNFDGTYTEQLFNEYSDEPTKTILSNADGKIIEIKETLEDGVIRYEKFDKKVTKPTYYNEFGEEINPNSSDNFEDLLDDSNNSYNDFGPVARTKDFQAPEEFQHKSDKQDKSGEFLMEDDVPFLFEQGILFSKN